MDIAKLTRDDLKEAIAEGIRRAFWDMITNATSAPCADFYAAVQDGVERAVRRAAPQQIEEPAGPVEGTFGRSE
jgi:hypothetical protein